jgi:hypothetical protein
MNYLHQIIAFLNDAEDLELDKQTANKDENRQLELFS